MKALFAFIGMAVVILALIEINERRKAKKNPDTGTPESRNPEDCEKKQACSECGLVELCDKSSKSTAEP